MQIRNRRRLLTMCVAVATLLLTVTYVLFRTSSVRVDNQSAIQVSAIRVELGEKVFWTGSLAAGQSHRSFGTVPKDGYITIEFRIGAEVHRRIFSAVTTMFPGHHELTITPELDIKCASNSADCVDLTSRWNLTK